MKYTKEFVIEFANLARGNPMEPIEDLLDRFFECYQGDDLEQPPPEQQQNIYYQVLAAAAEMCNVTLSELQSGKKYGDIPTVKQLTSKILSELEFSQEKIAKELPLLGKRNAIQQQVQAATKYSEHKPFRNVLEQLRERFDIEIEKA